jgi:hypothetical protein
MNSNPGSVRNSVYGMRKREELQKEIETYGKRCLGFQRRCGNEIL